MQLQGLFVYCKHGGEDMDNWWHVHSIQMI